MRPFLVFLTLAVAASAQNDAGRIAAVIPSTSVFRGAGAKAVRTPATKDQPVQWNDIIRTESSGRARIALADQSILTLGSNSTLRVVKHDARSQQTALELGYGRIRCQIRQLTASGSRFELRTPTAVAGVIGTDFGADSSDPDETRFVCVTGAVRVRSSDPNITAFTDCTAGMSVTVRRGQAPGPAEPATPEQIERWQHITEPGDDKFDHTIPPPAETPGAALRGRDPFPWLNDTASGRVRWGNVDVSGSVRFRLEGWDFFAPPPGVAGENSYAFAHSTLKFMLSQNHERWAWGAEATVPVIFGAPDNAVSPAPQGQLGLGATYFLSNSSERTSAYVFPSQLWIRAQGFGGDKRNQFTLGRYRFIDGAETKPADPTVNWLKRVRIAHRLLGDFAFTATGRSHDGAQLALNSGKNNFTFAAARPTAGVFKVNGLGELDIAWAYGAWTRPVAGNRGEVRLFGLGYGDARAIVKTDNRPLAARSGADRFENIALGTFGGHYLYAAPSAHGTVDFLLWGVVQAGSWGVQDHRAGAFAAEIGWQPKAPRLKPWLRFGYNFGSGDGDPNDGSHNTFFPVLPTPRQYARYPFYNTQNNHDVSAMLILRPDPRFTVRSEAHFLWLAASADLWYSGGGAYSRGAFGYQGRPSGGQKSLANVWDVSAEYRPTPQWSLGAYYAHAWGGDAVKATFPTRSRSQFGFVEVEFRF